ncbi:radical SAM family heme chaperone HemW [Bermanella sp. WJH001]|uniref:radical SAM family heme chaperone HemW n=1 Tax=Bermanella sp. WJH001 TaxID=3048005 RepID=UPI0024BDF293|nr:radical SAM family heme chaperone HemW [Bermanella sp. WJH001]MDJ1538779.1 radical SAM family heme chaperone HemW [Bermanella sp. WJH001]
MTPVNHSETLMVLPPLSLYIHVPWCVRKCPYCDFNSHKADATLPEKEYVCALLDDLDIDLAWLQQQGIESRPIQSIFIGGGTPSLLSVAAYEELFSGLKKRLQFVDDIEITMEANPGTFEAEKFKGYRELGINRLSIGIQSFQDHQLKHLGRIHSGQEAINAVNMAKAAGFDNFNLDFMHGLPDQTLEDALADLQQGIDLKPTHLSWYQLTIEPNTEFFKRPPVLPQDETLWAIQEAGQQLLADNGYDQYEISAYAKQGKQAKHNLNYWQFGDYLGIGAGAHGKLTIPHADINQSKIYRTAKTRLPKDYLNLAKRFLVNQDNIEVADRDLEFLMNGLRLYHGVDKSLFSKRTGLSYAQIENKVEELVKQGLLEASEKLKTTTQGQLFLNELLEKFL